MVEFKKSSHFNIYIKKWNHLLLFFLSTLTLLVANISHVNGQLQQHSNNISSIQVQVQNQDILCKVTEDNKEDFISHYESFFDNCDIIEFDHVSEIQMTRTMYITKNITFRTNGLKTTFKTPQYYYYTFYMSDTEKVIFEDLEIEDNRDLRASGPLIYLDDSELEMVRCKLSENTAFYGGVFFSYHANITIKGSEIRNNQAIYGGGVLYAHNSYIDIEDSSLIENKADKGSIAYLNGCDNILTLKYNTFKNNEGEDTSHFVYELTPGCNQIEITKKLGIFE